MGSKDDRLAARRAIQGASIVQIGADTRRSGFSRVCAVSRHSANEFHAAVWAVADLIEQAADGTAK
jgi:hypothetical protein